VIIWNGLGYLVAVIVFGMSFAMNLIFNDICGDGYYDNHKWPFSISLICSAIICWVLGNHLKRRAEHVVIEKETGMELVINKSNHSLFFIPMHYWGPLLFGISLIVFAFDLLQ